MSAGSCTLPPEGERVAVAMVSPGDEEMVRGACPYSAFLAKPFGIDRVVTTPTRLLERYQPMNPEPPPVGGGSPGAISFV